MAVFPVPTSPSNNIVCNYDDKPVYVYLIESFINFIILSYLGP